MSGRLRTARREDLARLWPAVKSSQLCDTAEGLEDFWAEAPWRVQVGDLGEAAILDRWRELSDILAIRGLWCSPRRVPELLGDLRALAGGQGFHRLLSPLVAQEATGPYIKAGMRPVDTVVALRLEQTPRGLPALPSDVTLRAGLQTDLVGVLAVDSASFDWFWAYDAATLAMHVGRERMHVATSGDSVIGYTLCTVGEHSGMLGRLAVAPEARCSGVGSALLAEAVSYMQRAGATCISLCTQEGNAASRALYRRAGFRELGGRLSFLVFDPA